METEKVAIIALIAISFAISMYAYPMLPESVASHWNAAGEADGHMPAIWGAFLMPALSVALFLLFLAIPVIDPLRANIEAFKKDYYRFILVMLLFIFAVHAQSLLWNMGTMLSFRLTMPILLGGLIFYLGDFLGKAKRNWFIGIRTPWTLSSDAVWEKTHRLGSRLFKAAGIASVASILLPADGMVIVVALIIGAAVATMVYSYMAYRELLNGPAKEKRPMATSRRTAGKGG